MTDILPTMYLACYWDGNVTMPTDMGSSKQSCSPSQRRNIANNVNVQDYKKLKTREAKVNRNAPPSITRYWRKWLEQRSTTSGDYTVYQAKFLVMLLKRKRLWIGYFRSIKAAEHWSPLISLRKWQINEVQYRSCTHAPKCEKNEIDKKVAMCVMEPAQTEGE